MEFKGEVIVKHLFNLEDEALGLWQCKLCPSEAKRKKQGENGKWGVHKSDFPFKFE
jgi:hypothetical protein